MLTEVDFRMRVIKFHRSSFERQISEAVSNSRNLIHNETGPPSRDRTTGHGDGIGEEIQGLATIQCEYNTLIVVAPSVQPDVTITHKMGLGTAGLEHGVATVSSATTNLLLDTNS